MAGSHDPPRARTEPPGWKAGLAAARANLLPGLFIQCAMMGVLFAYYCCGAARASFNTVAGWKQHYGYGFTAVVTAFAAAVFPEIFRIAMFQRGSLRRQNF